ncbi:hypothetical protein AYI69_g6271 [Smittium culicis]|uniref:Uncharacterized protein n=1 Tax=Smittium culicis TaxID=133412 RepID=A0A1R1Y078_9FUNG|nr:hypothetical protein AYI69_g6271 [Smittium culicis]
MINAFINNSHTDWDLDIHMLAFAHRSAIKRSMGIYPFMALYDREPRLPCDPIIPDDLEPISRKRLRKKSSR